MERLKQIFRGWINPEPVRDVRSELYPDPDLRAVPSREYRPLVSEAKVEPWNKWGRQT